MLHKLTYGDDHRTYDWYMIYGPKDADVEGLWQEFCARYGFNQVPPEVYGTPLVDRIGREDAIILAQLAAQKDGLAYDRPDRMFMEWLIREKDFRPVNYLKTDLVL